ncbi:RBP11-like subunits of RNA polymerase [Fomitiporia mediterranea MF3/22]|uniref:RBP11-like subunits of RNA polymerase n=1 Tax=Fomitiporia mediterranea (strain MF3/22) TaxID=694068 RepID=UPI0004409C5D|nr:RBP11-like subunits of RNA polymerase [Fomitiporia mediterranea MF3/22]EJD02531.1 RBP11-like subunits of RNA polymerase [Fomitiporia mediterranea MF3/22]
MTESVPKITIMKGATPDLSAATFRLNDESHTIGNALRWMLMKNPDVEFCGYSAPHPSENAIQVRVQMYDGKSALAALIAALEQLDSLFATIDDAYQNSIRAGNFERWDERG